MSLTLFDMVVLMPRILLDANRRCAELADVFQRTLEPLLSQSVNRHEDSRALKVRLLPTSVKVAILIQNYARLVRGHITAELALAAGAFTIVYDDMLDSTDDEILSARMQSLFEGGQFEPKNDQEVLFQILYRWLQEHIPQASFADAHHALLQVHGYQTKSRYQQKSHMSDKELGELTRLKGGKGALVLFRMVHNRLDSKQKQIIEELGAYFQHVDDYQDRYEDKARGIDTLATCGRFGFLGVVRQTEHISRTLRATYGAKQVRVFVTGLYYWVFMVGLGSVLKVIGVRNRVEKPRRSERRYWVPLQLLF